MTVWARKLAAVTGPTGPMTSLQLTKSVRMRLSQLCLISDLRCGTLPSKCSCSLTYVVAFPPQGPLVSPLRARLSEPDFCFSWESSIPDKFLPSNETTGLDFPVQHKII